MLIFFHKSIQILCMDHLFREEQHFHPTPSGEKTAVFHRCIKHSFLIYDIHIHLVFYEIIHHCMIILTDLPAFFGDTAHQRIHLHFPDGVIQTDSYYGSAYRIHVAKPAHLVCKTLEIFPIRVLVKEAGGPIRLGTLVFTLIIEAMKHIHTDAHGSHRMHSSSVFLQGTAPSCAAHSLGHSSLLSIGPCHRHRQFRFMEGNLSGQAVTVIMAVCSRKLKMSHSLKIITLPSGMPCHILLRMSGKIQSMRLTPVCDLFEKCLLIQEAYSLVIMLPYFVCLRRILHKKPAKIFTKVIAMLSLKGLR